MRIEQNGKIIALGVLLFFSLWCCGLVSAGEIPNMVGSWNSISIEMFTSADGYTNMTPTSYEIVYTNQTDRFITGEESYPENGERKTESVALLFSKDGTRFWQDHTNSGLSIGHMVSDNEFYNYLLLPGENLQIIVTLIIKNGTEVSAEEPKVPDLVGSWNYTLSRMNGTDENRGIIKVESQEGQIFQGTDHFTDNNGTLQDIGFAGVVSDRETVFMVSKDAYYIGEITGNDTIHLTTVIPGDEDKTYLRDIHAVRNGGYGEMEAINAPDLLGRWKITEQESIGNGTLIDMGSSGAGSVLITNQSGQFFKVTKLDDKAVKASDAGLNGLFWKANEAFLTGNSSLFTAYEISDNMTIEAITFDNQEVPNILYQKMVKE
jgi:hypothetical protein